MKRPLAYITAAWCGDPDTDMELAARYCRMAYEAGFSPICPILYLPLFINDAIPEEHKNGIDMRRDMLRRSHVLVVCGDEVDEDVKNDIKNSVKVGCTGCNYCCPCPKGVDIPAVFQCYNQLSEDSHARWRYIQMTTFRKETTNAAKCVGCGACTKKCPQNLDIPQLLKEAKKELETPMFKIINWGTHFFHFY